MTTPAGMPPKTVKTFQRDLLAWFGEHRRILPWRRRRTSYRVWISELMLQQTRVETVIPYYRRFMRQYPSLRRFAVAPRADVLKAWEGLGYYARIRNAHDAAKQLVAERCGRFPRSVEALQALPGIGEYTAAAIGSLAMGLDAAVVDGNVSRVLARVMAFDGDILKPASRRVLKAWAQALLVPGKAGVSNEAVMELGALCCTPRRPRCGSCPVNRVCRAYRQGEPEKYPVRKRASKVPHKVVGAGVVVDSRGRILIAQRREKAMLGGLWEFPGGTRKDGETMQACIARELDEEMGIRVRVGDPLVVVRHAYSHFTIELHAHWARIRSGRPRAIECADYAWTKLEAMRTYPFSGADLKIIDALEANMASAGGRLTVRRS